MSIRGYIKSYIEQLKEDLDKTPVEDIEKLIVLIRDCYENNKQIFIMGNGGSASIASHMACDLSKTVLKRFYNNEKRLKVISLTDNVALMTAISNDLAYEEVFSQQLRGLLNSGDLVIIISGSGNSRNIIRAAQYAKEKGAIVFGILGFDGGEMLHMADEFVHFKMNHYGRIEDCHLMLNHIVTFWFAQYKDQKLNASNDNMANEIQNLEYIKPGSKSF